MFHISLELFPDTLELKTRIPSEEYSYAAARFSALIHRLNIAHPKDKSLGVAPHEYLGSWCSVSIDTSDKNRRHFLEDAPEDTCALLIHHPEGDQGGNRDDVPDWRFDVRLVLTESEYLAFSSSMDK